MFFTIAIIMGMLLFAAAAVDIKSKSISRGFIAAIMLTGLAGAFARENFGMIEAFCGLLIGICAVGISMISKGQIGKGDGLVIMAMGLMLGFRECLGAVCSASVIMALVSIIVLIWRNGDRNTRLPFIPALLAGYVICFLA